MANVKFSPVIVRGFNNYDLGAASDETAQGDFPPTLTQQHFKDDADINTIVHRFGLTGQLPENVRMPQYGDFTGISDYRQALHQVMAAEDAFMEMPARIRARFENDPAQFVDFCLDPANLEEARSLGLAVPKAVDPPGSPAGVPPATTPPATGADAPKAV